MTDNTVDLIDQLGNVLEATHPDPLRRMLGQMLVQLMDSEVSTLCGASYGERTEERTNARNGYRDRPFETRLGTVDLRIPKLRQGSYLPSFVEPRRRWERAFVSVVSEAYVQGVSTRRVEELVEAMGAKGMSRSEVSRMAKSLDEQVRAFRERPLGELAIPYLWLDGMYIKVRTNGRVVSRALLLAIAVNENGEREVLGVDVAEGEMESSWRAFLRGLVRRGLRGVQLVISDAHEGLRAAIPAVLNNVAWQRCYVHFMRNVLDKVPRASQGLVKAVLKTVFTQGTLQDAKLAMTRALDTVEPRWPRAAAVMRDAEDEVLTHYAFPAAHRRQIRSTNPLERLNKEIRRRTRVVGIFPNEPSLLRLVGAMLMEQDDEWRVGRRYFSATSMEELLSPPLLESDGTE